jgi:hypothetical protein
MIHTVNTEIERLKKSLEDRSREFDRLRLVHMKDSKENMALKARLEEMKAANEAEKKMLEHQVSQLIVSQAGHVASQKEKITQLQLALQDELTVSQNRIAEQEQEIRWLKKALDESNQFASQDQVQKLQHAIEVWQEQAKSAHHELTVVLGQAEELKTLNTTLQTKIKDLEVSKKQLTEELNESSNECADLTDKLYKTMKEKESIKAEQEAAQHAFEEARNALKDQIQVIRDRDVVLEESNTLVQSLRSELAIAQERLRADNNDFRAQNSQLSTKISDLEREKVDLAAKLNTALRSLEKKSQQMIEDANSKLQEHDQRASDAELTNRRLREELDRLRSDFQDLKSIHESKMVQRDRALEDMRKHYDNEHKIVAEQAAHVLALEGESEGLKDKIAKLQLKLKDKADAHTKTLEDLQSAIGKLEKELQVAKQVKEEDREAMMAEFEKILQEKRVLHKTELQGLQEQFERTLVSKDLDLKILFEKHDHELKEREIQFQSRLRDAESKLRQSIASEMDDGVVRLTEKHRQEIAHLKETHAQELQEAHTAMRSMLIKQKEEAITDLESKLETIHQAKLSAELEIQRQNLLREANERLESALARTKQEYELRLSSLSENQEDERQRVIDEITKSHELEKNRAVAEVERILTTQHGEVLAATQERHTKEMREKEIEFQKTLTEKTSAEVKRAVALERELLTLQFEDEKERSLNELRTKLMIDFNSNIQATRNALLEERARTMQELESTSTSILDEKEATIAQLTSQIKQLSSLHRDELSKALFEQQLGMIEKSNSELERIRAEYAERELKHQAELNSLYKANADDLTKQRQELEEAHEQIVDALRDELRQAREKIREALEMKTSSQNVEAALRIEHQKQLDELLTQKLAEARASYETTVIKIQKQHSEETSRLRGTIEKLESEYTSQLDEKDQLRAQEIERIRQQLVDRHNKELQTLRQQYEDDLEHARHDALLQKDEELKKERVELRGLLAAKAHDIQELEEKIEALNQSMIDLTVKYNRERLDYLENFKQKQAQLEKNSAEELERMEANHANAISDLRSQHMEQVQSLREEMSQKYVKQFGDSEQMQRQKDEFFQQEISRLRKELQDATQSRHVDTSQLEQQMRESLNTIASLNEEIQANKLRWMNEKERLRLTMDDEYAAQLKQERQDHDRAISNLKERYELEISKLQDHWEDSKGNHDSLVQALRSQLQESKRNSQAELERLQTSLMHSEERLEQVEANAKREREQMLLRFERDKAASQSQHEESIAFEREEAQNVLEKRLTDQKERFERAIHTIEEQLHQEKEFSASKIKELQDELHMSAKERELMLEEKISHFDETLVKEKALHDQVIRQLEEDFDRRQDEFEDSIHQLRLSLQQEKDRAKEMEQEWEQSLDIKESVIQELTTKQAGLKDQIVDLRDLVDNLRRTLEERDDQQAAQQRSFEQEIEQLKAQQEKQLSKVQSEHSQAMQDLREEHVEETRKLKRLLENEIASLKHGLEVASSEAARNIDEVERRYQLELAKKAAEVDAKRQMMDNLKEENIRAIETVQAELGSQIQEARRTAIRSKEVEIADLRHALEDAEAKGNTERTSKEALQRQLRSLERENQSKQQEMEAMRQLHGEDTTRALADLKAQHAKALELLKRNEEMKLQQTLDDHAEEVKALQARIDQLEHRGKDHEKKQHEQLSAVESLEQEKAQLADKLKKMDEHAALRVQQLQQNQESAIHALQEQLAQLDKEKQEMMNEIRQGEADRARSEANFLRKLDDKEATHADEMERALEDQKKELQEEYLNSIRQQIDLVVSMIQAQAGGKASDKYIQELQSRFMDLVQGLPDLWKQRHGVSVQERLQSIQVTSNGSHNNILQRSTVPRTPIHILADASIDFEAGEAPYFENIKRSNSNSNIANAKTKTGGVLSKDPAPWSSPSLRASPTDQLIAAILDGDVQGIRAVVRSKGDDLRSEFWSDLAKSVLPIHRAISGLHFHGSEKLLIATIEVLVQLGAEINAIDHAGNSVLHKAIQVCTSKSAAAVVQCLLNRGANPRLINKEGDTPLHAECRRVRTASVEVIEALLASGADPNIKNPHNLQLTPLTLVLLRGASTTPTGMSVIYPTGKSTGADPLVLPNGSPNVGNPGLKYSDSDGDQMQVTVNQQPQTHPKSSSRKTWLKAAELLVKSGAYWEASWRSPHGCTQLHLLLAAFPPTREDSAVYRALLKSCLDAGVNPAQEDQKGRNALFVLCEQMAATPADQAPDAPRLIHILIEASSVMTPQQQQYGIGGSDRTGRTIFDIHESVAHSCLHACKSLLVQATSKAAAVSAASGYRGIPPSHGSSRSNAGYELEKERVSKVSSAMIAQMTNHNSHIQPLTSMSLLTVGGANHLRSRSASSGHSGTSSPRLGMTIHSSSGAGVRASSAAPQRGYFDDVDGDDDSDDQRPRSHAYSRGAHVRHPSTGSAGIAVAHSASHTRRPSASSDAGGVNSRW